jgi:hypothetical protein
MSDKFNKEWDDFSINIGSFSFGIGGLGCPFSFSRTENSHILRLKIDTSITKEQIKVRLINPGEIEIEWPRKTQGEEIPVE